LAKHSINKTQLRFTLFFLPPNSKTYRKRSQISNSGNNQLHLHAFLSYTLLNPQKLHEDYYFSCARWYNFFKNSCVHL